MRVIGTAGHVDHGKSTLIQALTGTHPDRLKEEQEREMTIDLGFAWWSLPDGEEVGVVDVPGHRDFIENMLAGVGGIDAALFVVAADEGVMPQTREHLAILDILQIQSGVVALTKIDTVADEEWLDLVEEELIQVFSGTVLENAPIVRVSAKTGKNIEALQTALQEVLSRSPHRPDLGRPRLPIDRVFTIAGFGTVVTGTLVDGHLSIGDEVVVIPGTMKGRVRGLQTHKRKEERALPGSRTAVNISGIDLQDVQRGQVVAYPDTFVETRRMDVEFRLLADVSRPLEHNTEVKLFVGAAEMIARVRLIGVEKLLPGETGWLQLELVQPVVAARGDRYILRRPSPGETLGGGVVLDPQPKRRYKRFSASVLDRLKALSKGSPEEVLLQALITLGAAPFEQLKKVANLEASIIDQAVEALLASGQMVVLDGDAHQLRPKSWVASRADWEQGKLKYLEILSDFHKKNPLRLGMPTEEIKSRIKITPRLFSAVADRLSEKGEVVVAGALARLPDHQVEFAPKDQAKVDRLLERFSSAPFSPPTIKDSVQEIGEDLYQALVALGILVPVSAEVVFRAEDLDRAVSDVKGLAEQHGSFTLAQARDHWNTTRRYVQDLLEYLDRQGITVRIGDGRKIK
ncbi:MAG TPA: selenocysteine-specific translation elongation factor [Anaerolineales bacterium]|jgi:selenocysteine-specific elongation factor|nr:selenocysteine-specific translation elongation factor [Anaerolineales bacterium]